jgi:hypothetical protein
MFAREEREREILPPRDVTLQQLVGGASVVGGKEKERAGGSASGRGRGIE